ncbi:MAG: DNA polymerase I [Deltaproteobacteria bacterium]|nr:DNA polymerase I [Deltaproteobacteria bacterium]
MDKEKKTLILIDGNSLMYRAFHAVPASFMTSKGIPTNAVYGFTQSILKIINEYKPAYLAVAFDVKGPSFRKEIYDDYKANRPPMPDALSRQAPYIKKMLRAMRVRSIEKEGFEADDVMATIVKNVSAAGVKTAMITGDKDMYQLVSTDTKVLDYLTGKEWGPVETEERFGVPPTAIKDFLALAGDASDNIPGVKGVGTKTAVKLIKEYGTLDALYADIASVRNEKLRKNLIEHKDDALTSRELVALHPDVPIDVSLTGLEFRGFDMEALKPLLVELEFKKLVQEMFKDEGKTFTPTMEVREVLTNESLGEAAESLKGLKTAAITLMQDENGEPLALAISAGKDSCFCIRLAIEAGNFPEGVSEDAALRRLRVFAEDAGIQKNTDDSKALYRFFMSGGVTLRGISMDTSLASYVLNPSKSDHSIAGLTQEYLGKAFENHGEDAIKIASEKVRTINEVSEILHKKLEEDGLLNLYQGMELPMSAVLADMEEAGVRVDAVKLEMLSREIGGQLTETEREIYNCAGCAFNISSPKQLSEVLFDKLKLKPVKKTKTGFSTDEEVLTKLAVQHDVPQKIIAFRQLSKLKSTYVDAILELTNPKTGRIHTTFNQTVTATGRLSSSRPNLQNIPVRGELASRIREAFVADPGCVFISSDYSQIELRIVAHFSEDPALIEAFIKNADIHTATASGVFGVLPGLVTPEMRRRAKAINFGIIYGMGAYGLSTELGIPVKEAEEYITAYFSHYSRVKEFIDYTVAEAARAGFTTTLFGRRRFIHELKSPVEAVRRFGERAAINTPVQGTAADMIKAAMIRIFDRLKDAGLKSRMLLQIHDELIFESPVSEQGELCSLIKKEMEGVVSLKVPVKVNIKQGANWGAVE